MKVVIILNQMCPIISNCNSLLSYHSKQWEEVSLPIIIGYNIISLLGPHNESNLLTCFNNNNVKCQRYLANLDWVQGDQQWVKCQQATGTQFHLQFHEHKGVEVAYHATTTWTKARYETQGEPAPRKHTSGYSRCFLHVRKEKVTTCMECTPVVRTTQRKVKAFADAQHLSMNNHTKTHDHTLKSSPQVGQGKKAPPATN